MNKNKILGLSVLILDLKTILGLGQLMLYQLERLELHSVFPAIDLKKITRRAVRDLVIALLPALVFLGIGHLATRKPWGVSTGFPLDYGHYNLRCSGPNPFNGCGYSYDPVLAGLDFLFWLTVAFALTLVLDMAGFHQPRHEAPPWNEWAVASRTFRYNQMV